MQNIFLYAHGGSGNHGCEAIVRSTVKILNKPNITLISSNLYDDKKYGIDRICNVIEDKSEMLRKSDIDFWKAYVALKIKKDYIPMDKLWYKDSFSNVKKGDIALSIGGDNYCYADVGKYVMMHEMLKDRGAKTVLWGCSVEPDVAKQPSIRKDIASYDLITARETITYDTLKMINPNTILVSDPAFQLDIQETELPDNFIDGNTVGINISPMIMDNETLKGMAWNNYTTLIEHILSETDMNIALIPHVVWKGGDDRVPLNCLYEQYKDTGRIGMVTDRNCMELKYIISKCRFFVGARTHSTIAAYSTGVPTLVVGYSVKSKGIARDLFGTEEGYVVPVQGINETDILWNVFKKLIYNENEVKEHMKRYISEYRKKALAEEGIRKFI